MLPLIIEIQQYLHHQQHQLQPEQPLRRDSHPLLPQVVDLGDFIRSLSMHTTGQSGHPYHPRYGDMIGSWRNIENIEKEIAE